MANVTIRVINDSSQPQKFLIYNSPPQSSGPQGQPLSNVWGVSPGVGPQGGSTQFNIAEEYYGICGNSPSPVTQGTVIDIQSQARVNLTTASAPGTKVPVLADGGAVFFDNQDIGQTNAGPGTYELDTTQWNTAQYRNAYVGLGRRNPSTNQQDGFTTPVAVIPAEPAMRYLIAPTQVYYITTGDYTTGTIVDYQQIGVTSEIDFTGRSETQAVVHFQNDGTYSPVQYN